MPKICPRIAQDMTKIGPRYAREIYKQNWGKMSTIFTKVGAKCPGAKCPWGKMSVGQNVSGAKCPLATAFTNIYCRIKQHTYTYNCMNTLFLCDCLEHQAFKDICCTCGLCEFYAVSLTRRRDRGIIPLRLLRILEHLCCQKAASKVCRYHIKVLCFQECLAEGSLQG